MLRKEDSIIISTIAEMLVLPNKFFNSKTRNSEFVFGRYILCRQLRKRRYTYAEIGAIIGRDHSTAIYLIHKYKPPMHLAKLERSILNEIDRRLKESIKTDINGYTVLYAVLKLIQDITYTDPLTREERKDKIKGLAGFIPCYETLEEAEEAADGKFQIIPIKPA